MPLSYRQAEREIFDPSNDPILRPGFISEEYQATAEQLAAGERRLRDRRRRWRWARLEPDSALAGRLRTAFQRARSEWVEQWRALRSDESRRDRRRWLLREAARFRALRRRTLGDLAVRRIWYRELPFYRAGFLLHCDGDQPSRLVLAGDPAAVVELLGLSAPIHTLNHGLPLRLDDDVVEEYLNFFCEHVHGDHGGFLPIEEEWVDRTDRDDPDRLILTASDLREGQTLAERPAARTAGKGLRRCYPRATIPCPITIIATGNSTWTAMVSVVYAADVFRAVLLVQSTGEIEMLVDRNIPGVALQGPTVWWHPKRARG